MSNLHTYRQSYEKGELNESNLTEDPFTLFDLWFKHAETSKSVREVNAMTVSTIGADGFPHSRVVLLKEYSAKGFVFYTNYSSKKSKDIVENNNVCISFFWPNLEQQIIIKGSAEKVSETQSKIYFESRPRGSQLGAWASRQSSKVESRTIIENRLKVLEEKFKNTPIPKPEFWGGFIIQPISFEFWQGRSNRLHDRFLYSKTASSWMFKRLEP